jgi:ComF family protein
LHKDSNERRLAGVFAELLEERISAAWPGWPETVTWVPSSREAVTRRGFDHAEALGRELAQRLGVPAARALERGEAADQRRLDRKQRAANVRGTFTRSQTPLSGRIVLVDDVVTTCATSDAAASMLLESGAEAVRLAGVARTW